MTENSSVTSAKTNDAYRKYFSNAGNSEYGVLIRRVSPVIFVFETVILWPYYLILINYIASHSHL